MQESEEKVPEEISISEIKCHNTCPMKRAYQYVMLRKPIENAAALNIGTAFHAGMNAWWSVELRDNNGEPKNKDELLESALYSASKKLKSTEGMNEYDLASIRAMLLLYHSRWKDQLLVPLAVEQRYKRTIANPYSGRKLRNYVQVGSIDVVAFDPEENETVLVEHKSTSFDISPGEPYWKRLLLNSQVSNYFEGAIALGYRTKRYIYDVIRKPTIRPLKATPEEDRKFVKATGKLYANQRDKDETPDEYFDRILESYSKSPASFAGRQIITLSDQRQRDAQGDLVLTLKAINEYDSLGHWPRNDEGCNQWNKMCQFFGVCTGEASIDDFTMFVSKSAKHEELL